MQSVLRQNEFIQALEKRIQYEFEERIDKPVPRQVTVWHQAVCLFV